MFGHEKSNTNQHTIHGLKCKLALKMNGAGALDLYWAIRAMQARQGLYALMSRRVIVVGAKALGASLGEATTGADLGGSSNQSG